MKITLLAIGKTDEPYLREGIENYRKRLVHYTSFELIETQLPKKHQALPPALLKQKEAEIILTHIEKADFSVLLDERGKTFSSVEFAGFLQQRLNHSVKNLLFVIGGAWGFDDVVYQKASMKLSLSAMTFSHQMTRLFFTEQLYRAFTILRNESYHNE
ncbi:MAG: 23S rRNA (pseudouridine(1915)-N(3))-methyltransferase RlmH [Bacteroides sp.]|jgi:23S rRNA (pseudouridine1915-N3)-methyltransferase|nr:23S rRNA (pseudouridine(1915)-N(3))-methyltransferase RlmH [Bacteroides sp.]